MAASKIIRKSVKMNLSPTTSETFCNGLDFETLRDSRHCAQCLPADAVGHKIILKTNDNFQTQCSLKKMKMN